MFFLTWISAAWAGDCPQAPLVLALGAAARVEVAYVNADEDAFGVARWQLEQAVPCIVEEVSLADAVTLHRARSITSLVDGDPATSARSLAAMRTLQPGWQPPQALMPPGHPLRKLWDAGSEPGTDVDLPENRGGYFVDGSRAAAAPEWRAFVLQAFAPDGDVLVTRYCESSQCLDEAVRFTIEAGATRREIARRRAHRIGTIAGGVLLLAGGAELAVAAVGTSRIDADGYGGVADRAATVRQQRLLGGVGTGVGASVIATTWVMPW